MPWTDYGWEDDPSTATPLDAEKLEDFGEHVHDAAAATAATGLAAHTGDTSAAHAASAIGFTPAGTVASTDVQAAVAEVASEAASNLSSGLAGKADLSGGHVPLAQLGSGSPASGKYVDGASGAWLSLPAQSGSGLPDGGTTGQVLTKASGTDGDAGWEDADHAPTDASVTVAKLAGSLEAVMKGAAVHDGSSYPARPPFGSVEWIGPTDPGELAEDGDTWVATA